MRRLVPLLLLAGCVINSDKYTRPRDLAPQAIVTSLRILAIQADPPELAPGETAVFRALIADPDDLSDNTLWVACGPDRASDFGCPFDPAALDEDATIEDLIAAGVIGFEPDLPPSLTADAAWLEGLSDDERLEGINWTVNALALPADAPAGDDFDFNSVESAFKRVVVSEAPTPNNNPGIVSFAVDGVPIDGAAVVLVDAGEPYELAPILADDAIETYTFRNVDGEDEQRVEKLYAEWYATGGTVDEFNTLDPFLESTWIAPSEPEAEGTWWVVLKDRRGGIAFAQRRWRTR